MIIIFFCFPFIVLPEPCPYNCTCHRSPWDGINIFDCRNKGLTSLPQTVLEDTDWLLLSGNNLGSLNIIPYYPNSISLLNLSSSNITDIDEKVIEILVKDVKHLDVRGNYLKTLPQTITKANNMTKLWLSDNPYQCECDMLWMKDWLIDAENVMDKNKVKCSGYHVQGETIH